MEAVRRMTSMKGCFTVDSIGTRGGLCLMWEEGVEVDIKTYTSHHIDAWVQWEGRECRVTGMYG